MAILHVKSTGSATAPYETWAKAATGFEVAYEAAGDGDTVYVHSSHDDTGIPAAAVTLTQSAGNRVACISVDAASETTGATCTYTTGAKIGVAAASGYLYTFATGEITLEGFTVKTDVAGNFISGNSTFITFVDCTIEQDGWFGIGGAPLAVSFVRCTFKPQWSGQWCLQDASHQQTFLFDGCTIDAAGGNYNYWIRFTYSNSDANVWVRNCDFSAAASGFYLFDLNSAGDFRGKILEASGVRMPATHTITDSVITYDQMHAYVSAMSVGSGANLQSFEYANGYGAAVDDTAVYVSAAATYDEGTGRMSAKVTPTATSSYDTPFRFPLWEGWTDANPTLTAEMFYDSATSLTDANCWLEVEFPIATNFVQKDLDVSSRATPNATGTALTASALGAGDWTGESGSNQNFDKIGVTISGGAAGIHRVWLCYGPGATTPVLYVNPDVTVA